MMSERQFARCAFLGVLALLALSRVAAASNPVLNDWCVNLNGDINTACNGAGTGGGSINMSGFDTTLSPTANGLGTITIMLDAGDYASFYADYDVDFGAVGSFQDYATTGGTLPSNWSYEADDPNTSNIFADFASNSPLADTNNVWNLVIPDLNGDPICCDVSFALSVDNTSGSDETLTFDVTDSAPASGFYIQQTNFDGDSIYLSATEGNGTASPVPEPSTLILVALGGLSMLMSRRLCAAR